MTRPGGGEPEGSRWSQLVFTIHSPMVARFILVAALVLTGVAWRFSQNAVDTAARERFEFRTSEIESSILERMQGYETVLWSGVGLFGASEQVDRDEWASYVASLRLDERWPGIQGVGVSVPIAPEELAAHEAQVQAEGFADYRVNPVGERDLYSAIIYLEPFDWRNQRAFGFDMWSNPERRAAMARARDTGQAATSGRITLVQETDEDVQHGFLTYVPVYEADRDPTTVDERRAAFVGWVYAPFRMNDLMQGVVATADTSIDYAIYDGTTTDPDRLLYATSPDGPADGEQGDLVRTATVELQGHPWTMAFRPGATFDQGSESLPTYVAIGALLVDLLLFYVISSLGLLTRRADRRAEAMNAELVTTNEALHDRSQALEHQTSELRRTNDELRQFAHVSSHDFQEPLRTMSSYSSLVLTRYGEEIGDDGQRWLGYIAASAKRMSALVRDIVHFSSHDDLDTDRELVDLNLVVARALDELATDLTETQARVEVADLPVVVGDAGQLGQVLVLLVDNAIRHRHPDRCPLVSISATAEGTRWRVDIADDGPGIEPELQDRIFDVFRRGGGDSQRSGTGMGLPICRKVVRKLGGDVGVESTPGQGSRFWFTLPAPPGPTDDGSAVDHAPTRPRRKEFA